MEDSAHVEAISPNLPRHADAIGDQLTYLLDHYEQSLFAFLRVLLADAECAKDCTQDTFLRAYENLRREKPVNAQWLYKVARNRAIDELRRRSREHVRAQPIEEAVTDETQVSDRVVGVERALRKLSPSDREVLYLAEVDGFSSVEIGAMLGIRPGTVRMRLCRAHVRFREAFGERS